MRSQCRSYDSALRYCGNIVYSAQAADVDTVIIDGQIVMENRRVTQFDEQEVLAKCQALARDLIAR